jgi:transposase
MMGKKGSTGKMFYQFSIEERVPEDHLLRRVAEAVDFSFVRRMTARFYSHTGQPSIDPVVIFKMALLSFLYGITSERRLVEEIRLNLAYLSFIGYDLDESVPDHSVLSRARVRYGLTVYLGFFKEIVRQCEQAGLIQGNRLYADSTLVQANADINSIGSRALIAQLPDIDEHVAKLWQENSEPVGPTAEGACAPTGPGLVPLPSVAASISAPTVPVETAPVGNDQPAVGLSAQISKPTGSPESTDGNTRSATLPKSEMLSEPETEPIVSPQITPPSVASSLHLVGKGDPPNKVVGLLNERQASRTDPEAELVGRTRVPSGLYHKIHATVDGGKARIVTAIEVTGGSVSDEHLLERLIQEHEGNVGRRPKEVGADAKYGTAENYAMLERLGILGSIPMRVTGTDTRDVPPKAFAYDPKSDSFVCPSGQRLKRHSGVTTSSGQKLITYRAKAKQCATCPLKEECCGKAEARSLSRPDDGGLRDRVADYLATARARQTIRRRKAWIETIFGDGKERRGQRRARCRGRDKMRIQAWMIGIAQNVRQLALRKMTRKGIGGAALEKDSGAVHRVSLSFFLLCAHANSDHNLTLRLPLN